MPSEADFDRTVKSSAPACVYPLRVPAWRGIPGLVHGFLGRAHGLPAGSFSAAELRRRLASAGETAEVVIAARQIHSANVLALDHPERTAAEWETRSWPGVLPEA